MLYLLISDDKLLWYPLTESWRLAGSKKARTPPNRASLDDFTTNELS